MRFEAIFELNGFLIAGQIANRHCPRPKTFQFYGRRRTGKGSHPGGLGGLMGPERLLDFSARQLQTGLNRCSPQGGNAAIMPYSALNKSHTRLGLWNSRAMSQITPLKNQARPHKVAFQRHEMSLVLDVYGRLVMQGVARDYAIGMYRDHAVFAIFRRHADVPTWTLQKTPKLAQLQGAYSVRGAQGQILRRGRELKQVLRVFDSRRFEIVKS